MSFGYYFYFIKKASISEPVSEIRFTVLDPVKNTQKCRIKCTYQLNCASKKPTGLAVLLSHKCTASL